MNAAQTAEYMRDHYSREEYLLLTLTTCSLLLSNWVEKYPEKSTPENQEIYIVEESLRNMRDSLDERELLAVSVMLAEIERLRSE